MRNPDGVIAQLFLGWLEFVGQPVKAASELSIQQGLDPQTAISVEDIARQLGFQVVYMDLPIGGYPYIIEEQRYIVVSSRDSLSVQEFTIAHEMAHHYLHLSQPHLPKNLMEIQAQLFAVNWLMQIKPKDFLESIEQNPDVKIAVFGTSILTLGVAVGIGVAALMSWVSSKVQVGIDTNET